ncbi:MAG: hypothetical protein WC866_06190 [Patescibacteria group bacterium]|jgi:hypothetical protein
MGYTLEQTVIEMGQEQKRLIPVEDGKWVVPHVGTGHSSDEEWDDDHTPVSSERTTLDYTVIGPEPARHVLNRVGWNNHYHGGKSSRSSCSNALIGDQPFGAILTEKENGRERFGMLFVCARQVHKGELGQRPVINRPRFAREAPVSDAVMSTRTDRPIPRRDRRRGHVGWARLADVAALLGMDTKELVLRYVRFAHAEHAILDVRFVEGFDEIHRKPARAPERFSAYALEKLFARDLSTAWIRKGFACTALYLHHLGHIPEPHVNAPPRVEIHSDAVAVSQ